MKEKTIKARCEVVKNEGSKELYLYGPVLSSLPWYDENSDNYIYPQKIKSFLDELDGEDIKVRINSNGGDVFAGITIYNQLKDYKGKVSVKVDGIAASAGSIIAIAGDTVDSGVNGMMMIHPPWTYTAGSSKDLRAVADDLEKIESSIVATYMTKFKGTEDELRALMEAESYLTAEECVALGFADEIEKVDDTQSNEDVKNSIVSKYIALRDEKIVASNEEPETKGSFFMNKIKGDVK